MKNTEAHSVSDSRLQTTCTVAIPLDSSQRWFAQILFSGKSTQCLPHGTFDSGLYLDYTENHWQSAQSLVRYLIFMDPHINNGTPEKAWLCILDAAPVHISVEFRCELQKAAKHIKLVFVSPGFTS
eukprot:4909566-Amphidinium_carterae.1